MRRLPLVALLVVGCLVFPEQKPCASDDECSATAACHEGECLARVFVCGEAFEGEPGAVCDHCFGHQPGDACGECLGARCCDQAEACQGDPDCKQLFDCFGRCSFEGGDDPRCLEGCWSGAANVPAGNLLACLSDPDHCQEWCGRCGILTPYVGSAECGQCVADLPPLCEGLKSCSEDPECVRDVACRSGCDDPACRERCGGGKPDDFTRAHDQDGYRCGRVCEVGGEWGCVGKYSWRDASLESEQANVELRATYLGGQNAMVTEIGARACTKLGRCTGGVRPQVGDHVDMSLSMECEGSSGRVRPCLDPKDGFVGYFEVTGEGNGRSLVPTLFHPGRPVFADAWFTFPMTDASGARGVARLGVVETLDVTLAHLVVVVRDCANSPAPGLAVELVGSAIAQHEPVFYTSNGAPTADASATGSQGRAFVFNIRLGTNQSPLATVRALREEDGLPLAEVQVLLKHEHFTVVELVPTF